MNGEQCRGGVTGGGQEGTKGKGGAGRGSCCTLAGVVDTLRMASCAASLCWL